MVSGSGSAKTDAVRAGYTMVELLVVVAIVALIAALSIGALMFAPRQARIRGTEALIAKIDAQFAKRMAEFHQSRDGIAILPFEATLAANTSTTAANPQRARVIAIKRAMRQSFPEMFYFGDVGMMSDSADNDGDGRQDSQDPDERVVADWNPVDYNADGTCEQSVTQLPAAALTILQHFRQVYGQNPNGFRSTHRPGTTRAECLYMIVTKCGSDAADFATDEIRDTDGDGLHEFVDKFGNPIQFFLWPSYYTSLMQNPGAETDSDDPHQTLVEMDWWSNASGLNRTRFEHRLHTLSHFLPSSSAALQPKSFRTYPLIVSAGPDGGFGFWCDTSFVGYTGEDGVMGTLDDTEPPPASGEPKKLPGIGLMKAVGSNGRVDPTGGDDGLPNVSGQPQRISAVMRIRDVFAPSDPAKPDGAGMDDDNIDNHQLRAR